MKAAFIALLILSLAFADVKEENGILILDDTNFKEITKAHDVMFVEFYSTKTPKSLELIHTIEKIRDNMVAKGMNPVIGKIDHASCPQIAAIYHIGSFPVLYLFKKGMPRFYDGELVENDMQMFMEKGVNPDLIVVKTNEEIQEYVDRGFPVLVGHFNKKSSKEFKNYRKAAAAFLDYSTLVVVGEANVDVPMNQVYIYTHGEVRVYDEKMTVKELKKWLSIKSLPLIVPYERKYMKVMFAKDNGVFNHLLFVSSRRYLIDHHELKAILEKIAQDYTSKIFVVNMYDEDPGMLQFFGITKEMIPALCMVKSGESEVSKYAFRGEFEDAAIRNYITAYFNDELKPYYRSEDPYPEREKGVKILVGSDFEQFVYDPNVNVLVEFVVPNCKKCDEQKANMETLASYFEEVPDMDVARIDYSKNDLNGIEMKNYPMFMMFAAGGDGRQSFTMEDNPNLGSLMKFIGDHRVKISPQQAMEGIIMMDGQDMTVNEEQGMKVEAKPQQGVKAEAKPEEQMNDEL